VARYTFTNTQLRGGPGGRRRTPQWASKRAYPIRTMPARCLYLVVSALGSAPSREPSRSVASVVPCSRQANGVDGACASWHSRSRTGDGGYAMWPVGAAERTRHSAPAALPRRCGAPRRGRFTRRDPDQRQSGSRSFSAFTFSTVEPDPPNKPVESAAQKNGRSGDVKGGPARAAKPATRQRRR
jgi:hypothetical protein